MRASHVLYVCVSVLAADLQYFFTISIIHILLFSSTSSFSYDDNPSSMLFINIDIAWMEKKYIEHIVRSAALFLFNTNEPEVYFNIFSKRFDDPRVKLVLLFIRVN